MNAIIKGGYQDVPMSRRRAQLLAEYAERLATMLENAPDDKDLAEWVQSKIDRAASAIQSAYHYLDQEDDLEKARTKKYEYRRPKAGGGWKYYYKKHHGRGGIMGAKLEAGAAFKLTFRGRRGHFHIESVQGDIVTVKHDGRANSKPVQMTKAEFRAMIKRQHGQALASHTEKLRRQVDKLKRNPTRKRSSLGLALHRLRQAAEKAGVTLPEEYQRKPKKKTAREAVQGQDNFDTMPEVESTGTARDQLTSTAQEIITEADQDHDERHDEHQSIEQFELGEHTHTKTGVKLFTAKQKRRTDRDEYRRRVEIAKKHNGRYERRYVKGFLFKTAEDARNFALEVEGGQVEESAETVTPHEDHPQADNFETMPEVESVGTPKRTVSEELNDINSELFKEFVLANVPEGARSKLENMFSSDAPYVAKGNEEVIPSWYTREVARALTILRQSVSFKGERTGLGSLLTQSQIAQLREILKPIAEAHNERDYEEVMEGMDETEFYYLARYSSMSHQLYDRAEGLMHYAATRDKETTPDTYADYTEWTNADIQEDIKRLLAQTPPEQHARLWSEIINPQLREIKKKGKVRDTPLTRAFKAEGWTPQGFFARQKGWVIQLEIRNGEPVSSDYEFKTDKRGRLLARTRYKTYRVTHGNYIEYGKWKPAAELLTPAGLGYGEGSIEDALKRSKGDSLGTQRQMIGALKNRIPSEIQRTHKVWTNQNGTEVRLYAKRGERAQDLSVKVEGGEYKVEHTKRGREFWQTIQGELNKLLSDAPVQTPQPSTPPREQAPEPDPSPARQALTETAREVVQGDDNFETMPEVEPEVQNQGAVRRRKEALLRLRYKQLLTLQDQETEETLDIEENKLNELASELLQVRDDTRQQEIESEIQALITTSREKVERAKEENREQTNPTELPVSKIINEIMAFKSDEIEQVKKYIKGYKSERYKGANKDLYVNEISNLLSTVMSVNYEDLSEKYSEDTILQIIQKLEADKDTQDLESTIAHTLLDQEQAPEPDPSPARQALTETADEIMSPSTSALNIDQANAQDTLTENRTRNPESKAADKALIESARELAKTSERGDEIRAAVLDLMNAQQLKRYKRATGETGLRAEDMIEKRRAARERLRGATSGATVQGADNFDTMPEVESTGTQANIEDLPPEGQRTAEDAKRFFGEPRINEATKRVTYERDGHIVTGPASGRGKGKFRYDLSLPRERFRDEPLLSGSLSSNWIGTYDTLDEALTAAINQYKPSDQMIDEMIESAKEQREVIARRMGQPTPTTAREQLTETAREVVQGETNKQRVPRASWRSRMVSYNKVDSIMEGKTPSRLPLKTQAQFKKIENLIIELEQMEQQRTKSGRLKDWQGIKAKREEILNARRVLLQKYASERTRTQHSALQDHTFLSYYKPAKSTATPEDVRDKHGDRRSDLRTLRRYFETHEPDQQGQLTEAAETLDTRSTQQKTFTPEIQTAISYPVYGRRRNRTKKSFESLFKTRKDGGIFRMSKGEDIGDLAYAIAENLPEAVREYKAEIGMEGLSSLIANEIREAIEQRETPAELKDRIGAVITQRAQDNAVRRKEEITGGGERSALREMRRNIMTPSGDGYFDHQGRGGPRSYVGLGAIEKTLDMSERLDDLYVDAIFKQALPPELERFKAPISRFEPKAADQVAVAFANKYETVGEIRDNISTIREQMRATIKSAVDTTVDALVKRPNTLDMIKRSHEMITEQHDTQRQEAAEASRALAQYTDDPQAHLAEIQELERQSDQAIAEQMEINREFANAYIHEASDLVERALESTKGEVIDSVMSVKTPKHANKFTASVQGKANRKLIARIFNEVFEQVRREIGDEPIERGEKHPRNIADTVKKPSKTPAQFRDDIERDQEEKKARARAKWEARRAQRTQKSALHLTNYRADLYRTIERLAS